MVCECILAGLFEVGFDGIISVSLTGSSEFLDIVSQCDTGPNVFEDVRKRLKGPSVGSMSLSAYAFEQGTVDKRLGTSCPSQAGVDLPVQQRFDCENNITRIIRTKTGQAFREGDPFDGLTLIGEFCSFRTINASASSGPATQVTDTERFLGSDLIWTGPPFSFDTTDPDSLDFTILGLPVKLTSFSISATAPGVATNSYQFQYSIPSCEGDLI
ncbi:MAG: hypothetical protein GF334_03325 [Candidatus Altiarchaeales archaeon]|nr:hypothetical protein [Candidatus Altiarchaeales archaeon]